MQDELTRLCLSAPFIKMDQYQAPEPKQHANQRKLEVDPDFFPVFPFEWPKPKF